MSPSLRPAASLALLVLLGCGGEAGDDAGVSSRLDAGMDAGPRPGRDSAVALRDAGPATDAGLNHLDGQAADAASMDAASPITTGSARHPDGRLAFVYPRSPRTTECSGCPDVDADGLDDEWEDVLVDHLRPLLRMDEGEPFVDDTEGVLAEIARVFPVAGDDRVRVIIVLAWHLDYGSVCGGVSSHDGDSERVALELAPWPEGGAGAMVVERAYTAAHEGTVTDGSQLFDTAGLSALTLEGDPPRWVVFPSERKHATYANIALCEGASVVPCVDEDCAPDGVADPARFDALPAFVNAGELDAPRVTALDALGFPDEDAWADQPFCGGRSGSGCPPSIREKLLTDPFE